MTHRPRHDLRACALAALALVALSLWGYDARAQECPVAACTLYLCMQDCCFLTTGSTCDSDDYCNAVGCALAEGCNPACMTATDAGHDAARDAGMEAGPDAGMEAGADASMPAVTDAGAEAGPDAAPDAGPDTGSTPGTPDGPVCYVFVHGSSPTDHGPLVRWRPEAAYWGTYAGPLRAHPEASDAYNYRTQMGRFAYSMISGQAATDQTLPGWDTPGPGAVHNFHWASVTWDGTWPYYWAALDVLQQLESIVNGHVPLSLAFSPLDVDKRPASEGGPLPIHSIGVNHCEPGDRLITIGHSMGNLVMAFLLENAQTSDLNYPFLRTGGMDARHAPFFVYPSTVGNPNGDHINNGLEEHSADFGAARWNENGTTTFTLGPGTLGTSLHNRYDVPIADRWALPSGQNNAGFPGDPRPPATELGTRAPPASVQQCFYPPDGFVEAVRQRRLAGLTIENEGMSDPRVAPSSRYPHEDALFPYMASNNSGFGPEPRCLSPETILARIAYHYSLSGPIMGTPIADCGCFNAEWENDPTDQPDIFAIGVCTDIDVLLGAGPHRTMCNGATYTLQTSSSVIVPNLGGRPSRRMFLAAGSDPLLPVASVHGVDLNLIAPVDSVYASPRLTTPLRLDRFSLPLNDQAVPVASAMACNVNLWSAAISMALTDPSDAVPDGFSRSMCGAGESVWPAAPENLAGVPDLVMAMHHGDEHGGVVLRTAYAVPNSFWTQVRDPLDASRTYAAGDDIHFGQVGSLGAPTCLALPRWEQYDPWLYTRQAVQDFDPRVRYFGFEHECVHLPQSWFETIVAPAAFYRVHRSMGHVLGIEERYTRRQNLRGSRP